MGTTKLTEREREEPAETIPGSWERVRKKEKKKRERKEKEKERKREREKERKRKREREREREREKITLGGRMVAAVLRVPRVEKGEVERDPRRGRLEE